jgi:hypothetical protein
VKEMKYHLTKNKIKKTLIEKYGFSEKELKYLTKKNLLELYLRKNKK